MHTINTAQMPGSGDLALCDSRFEADSSVSRDEQIQTLAAWHWDREIGEPISGKDVSEAIGEVLAGMDPFELQALSAAHAAGAQALGEFLLPKITGYWTAWCEEKARTELDKMDRESAVEAAAARMGN